MIVDDQQRRNLLWARLRLGDDSRYDDPVAITESVVALHSSDPATVYLSVPARMATPSLEPLERAMYTDRSLLRWHAMRRAVVGEESADGSVCSCRVHGIARAARVAAAGGLGSAQRADGSVAVQLLVDVDASARRAIDRAADSLRAVLGTARVTPRFPAPLQRALSSA